MKSIPNLIVTTRRKPHARRAYIRKRLISREKRRPRGYRHGTQLDTRVASRWTAPDRPATRGALPSIGKLQTTYRKDSSLPPSATTQRVVAGTLVTTQIWTRAGALVFALLVKQVMIRIEGIRAPGVLGFLRPEAQRAIKLVGLVVMVTFVIASLAWGYQQRQIARNWQKLACNYRLQDSVRRAPIMADLLDARDHDVLLVPGVESTVEGRHVLIYNADVGADKLRTFADLRRYRTPDWLVIAPHPFFPTSYCLRERLWQEIDLFDAIEFSHFYTPRIDFNRPAVKLAAAVGLPLVGTSDCHLHPQLGTTF